MYARYLRGTCCPAVWKCSNLVRQNFEKVHLKVFFTPENHCFLKKKCIDPIIKRHVKLYVDDEF